MNPMQLMELHKNQFTQNDATIYHAIKANPNLVVTSSTSNFANSCGVSQPALSRFVRGLGYARYRDFRSDLAAELAAQTSVSPLGSENRLPYFTQLESTIRACEQALTDEYMRNLAAYIHAHKRIYASGQSKSYHPAQLMEILMRRNRIGVHAVTSDCLHELIDYADEDDLIVLFSLSGRADHLDYLKDCQSDTLLITANPAYALGDSINRAVVLPYSGIDAESASVSPILFDVFVELLTNYCALG